MNSKEKKVFRNVRVYAETEPGLDGYKIYIDFSGRREFLYIHRRNGLLYGVLKDGIDLNELRRLRFKTSGNTKGIKTRRKCRQKAFRLEDSVNQLLRVIDEYFKYEMAA